jgi:hypothetical protein
MCCADRRQAVRASERTSDQVGAIAMGVYELGLHSIHERVEQAILPHITSSSDDNTRHRHSKHFKPGDERMTFRLAWSEHRPDVYTFHPLPGRHRGDDLLGAAFSPGCKYMKYSQAATGIVRF